MKNKESKEFRSLTFSQREGYADLPEALQPGTLTKRFRNHVWSILATNIDKCSRIRPSTFSNIDRRGDAYYWQEFFATYQTIILETPHDEVKMPDRTAAKKWLKPLILERNHHEIINILEHMLRTKRIQEKLANDIEKCFLELSAYFVDRTSEPVCVKSVTSKEMKESTKNSLDNINKSQLKEAASHLQKAAQQLNNKDFPTSVRESIQAVESATLQIYSKPSGKFADAVNHLNKEGFLKHSTWQGILSKLYGYASDRKNVRHSSHKPKEADVDFNEAICVYGVCVSIVDYLARQSDLLKDK